MQIHHRVVKVLVLYDLRTKLVVRYGNGRLPDFSTWPVSLLVGQHAIYQRLFLTRLVDIII